MKPRITLCHYLEVDPDDPLEEAIDSFDQLVKRLDELWRLHIPVRGERIAVTLTHANGSTLLVGFGDGAWMLFFEGQPFGHLMAVGDRAAQGSTLFALPELTEVRNKYTLSTTAAHGAIEHWMQHGEPTSQLRWA